MIWAQTQVIRGSVTPTPSDMVAARAPRGWTNRLNRCFLGKTRGISSAIGKSCGGTCITSAGGLVSFAISAADIALRDLTARVDGVPLWVKLGGNSNRVKPYAGGIDLHLPMDALLAQTRTNLEDGFRAIKMKVGLPDLDEDAARISAVRDIIGPTTPLMVDANMRWDVQTAIRASRRFGEFDVYWLEEPTIPDDFLGHARIAVEGGLPVASGENLHSVYEFRNMIQLGKISFPEPDVSNIGGITGWMRVARLAYAHNLPVTTHGVHELHLHLLALRCQTPPTSRCMALDWRGSCTSATHRGWVDAGSIRAGARSQILLGSFERIYTMRF